MARYSGLATGVQRFLNKARQPSKARHPWRRRTRSAVKLTPIQKHQLKLQRADRKEALTQALDDARAGVWEAARSMHTRFGKNSAEYYFRLIMQHTRLQVGKRRTSRWNAFLSKEMGKRNAALPEGSERSRVSDATLTREIAATWKSMTKEQQIAETEDRILELKERAENRRTVVHNVTVNAFNDTRATLESVEHQLRELHMRTGTEVLLIAVRSTTSDYNRPFVFYSSPRLADFTMMATQTTTQELAMKMEGYCISGVQGVAYNYIQGLLNLKKEAAKLILTKLQETSHRGEIGRMSYVNFDEHITERYGIVVENWPLQKFGPPGGICSVPELELLVQAWTSGSARFRSMDDDEWDEWKKKRHAGTTEQSTSATSEQSCDVTVDPQDTIDRTAHNSPIVTPSDEADGAHSTGDAAPTPLQVGAVDDEQPPAKRPRSQAQGQFITVDVVTGPDGRSIPVAKRQRKAREQKKQTAATSDAGATKSRRRRRGATSTEAVVS